MNYPDELEHSVMRVLRDHCSAERLAGLEGTFDYELWTVLEDTGYLLIGTPVQAGGSGGSLADTATVVRLCGQFGAQIPLAEISMLASPLAARAELTLPEGIVTAGYGSITASREGHLWRIVGNLPRVPYARFATAVVTTAQSGVDTLLIVVPLGAEVNIRQGQNLAGEPRDTLAINAVIHEDSVRRVTHASAFELRLRGALSRAIMISGAAQTALMLSLEHSHDRQQFGRPIGAFQAIQQQLAVLASEAAAVRLASDAAVLVACSGSTDDLGIWTAALAKVRAGRAAAAASSIAHQVHGAVGLTFEHRLRLVSTRLWSWGCEWGSEAEWRGVIARRFVNDSREVLWETLVSDCEIDGKH